MFLVISYWEALPGKEAEFEAQGPATGDVLRRQPGVVLVEAFKSGGKYVVVHGYEDEAAYHAIVDNPDGEFGRTLVANRAEELGRTRVPEAPALQPPPQGLPLRGMGTARVLHR